MKMMIIASGDCDFLQGLGTAVTTTRRASTWKL